jgi:hypothetical protein
VLTGQLDQELSSNLGRAARGIDPALLRGSPDQIAALPDAVQSGVTESFGNALSMVFLAAVPIALLALVIVIFLPELPLRTRSEMVDEVPSTM